MFGTKKFQPYLYRRKFKIVTDHRPLPWLFNCKDPSSKLVRWRLKLEEYDYEIMYKAGKMNSNADALFRPPIYAIDDNLKDIVTYETFMKTRSIPTIRDTQITEKF